MAEQDSTLACWRIGGQLDRSVCDPDGVWADIRVTCTLVNPAGGPVIDPSNGAHIVIMNEVLVIGGTADAIIVEAAADGNANVTADRQWYSRELKPNTATDPDLALQPSGTYWAVKLEANARRRQWVTVYETQIVLDGGRNYVAAGETRSITIDATAENVVNLTALEDPPATVPISGTFADRVLAVVAELTTPPLIRTYTLSTFTGTLPTGAVPVANYSSISSFESAVVPSYVGEQCVLAGYPDAAASSRLVGEWNGVSFFWLPT